MTTLTPEGVLTGIQELLDGQEWTVDMLASIAILLRAAGYRVRDVLEIEEDAA